MKSKQTPKIKNVFASKLILSVNSVYKFSELYLPYSVSTFTKNNSYFSRMALGNNRTKASVLGFQCVTESLHLGKACFEEKPDIHNTYEK